MPDGLTRRSEGEPSTTAFRCRRWIAPRGAIDTLAAGCIEEAATARARHLPSTERLTRTRGACEGSPAASMERATLAACRSSSRSLAASSPSDHAAEEETEQKLKTSCTLWLSLIHI